MTVQTVAILIQDHEKRILIWRTAVVSNVLALLSELSCCEMRRQIVKARDGRKLYRVGSYLVADLKFPT